MNSMVMGAKAGGKSEKDNWQTPPELLEVITEFFPGVMFDPCPANPSFNGLSMPWTRDVYVNPPFSQYLDWAEHGIKQDTDHQIWMCHHSHDTRWFKTLMQRASALCLLSKRVKFINPETGKSAGTAIGKCQSLIYIGHSPDHFCEWFASVGLTVEVFRHEQ